MSDPTSPEPNPAAPHESIPPPKPHHRPWKGIIAVVFLLVLLIAAVPWVIRALQTVSTDDAYVNGHVTFVAPRVAGQVLQVLVDDNKRVKRGDLLLQLDPEPYQVQVNIAQAALEAAKANLVVTESEVRGQEGQTRSLRFALQHAIEDVDNQEAILRSRVATLASKK